MNPFLIYLLKVNIALSFIFALYFLFFRNNTLFKSKRIFLWAVCAFSLIYPFVSVPINNPAPFVQNINYLVGSEIYADDTTTLNIGEAAVNTLEVDFSQIILLLYLAVTFGLTIRFIIQCGGLIKLIRKGKSIQLMGYNVIIHCKSTTPFSFFSWILMDNETSMENDVEEILAHEQAHVNQKHSVDVILFEIYSIFCWFNPLAWLLRKEVRLNLEYLADASVIRSGYNTEQYQFHILRLSYPMAIAQLYTGFNFSPLKKRIKMMNTKKTSNKAYLRYILFIPLIAALLFANQKKMDAMPVVPAMNDILPTAVKDVIPTENPVPEQAIQNPTKTSQKQDVKTPEKDENIIYDKVQQMPEYPGGVAEFLKYVQSDLIYPVPALEQGIQGTVRLRFVIKKDGSIGDVQVLRSLDPLCDKEAIKVIKNSQKWTPGKMKGEAVNVWYNVPVRFALGDPIPKTQTPSNSPKQLEVIDGKIYENVQEIPEYPGGTNEFLKFIQLNLKYPHVALEQGIEGTVRLRFIIKKDGSIGDVQILRSIDPACDKEAIRVVKESQKWTPGKIQGQAVDVWYNIPVKFTISGKDDAVKKESSK